MATIVRGKHPLRCVFAKKKKKRGSGASPPYVPVDFFTISARSSPQLPNGIRSLLENPRGFRLVPFLLFLPLLVFPSLQFSSRRSGY